MQKEIDNASAVLGFSPAALWTALGVIVGIAILAGIIIDLILKIRELRKPKVTDEKTIQDKLKSDHERLCKLEDVTERQDEELKLILRSQMAMIHHMVDGNGVDKLKETQRDIEDYLITGKIRQTKGE